MGDFVVKITILLAAYNGARFLPAQLQSLSDQTFTDFRVLFQDDGSTDETPRLLSAWAAKDPRFSAGMESGRRLGPVGNFFSLLRQADGDLLLFCDQDDLWEPHKLETLIRVYGDEVSAHPGQAGRPLLIHSDASLIDGEGRSVGPSFFRLQGWDPGATGLNRLLVQNNVTGCLMMINRPLADLALKSADPSRLFMHDWFLALTAAAFGRILFCPAPLVRYRQHTGNAVGASRQSLLRRGWSALRKRQKARDRVDLTYRHTRVFQELYGPSLPPQAADLIRHYLDTQAYSWPRRVLAVRRLGCVMQSPVTRLGQLLFG